MVSNLDFSVQGKICQKGNIIAYKNGFRYYIEPALGDKKLSKIRGEHIQQLFNDLEERGIAVSYIKVLAAVLNGCFKQAFKNGLIESNPVAKTTLPKQGEKRQRRVLTPEEQGVFLSMLGILPVQFICVNADDGNENRRSKRGEILRH